MDKETVSEWYRQMVLIRRFEERADELYQLEGKIKGFLHLYIGQEAIAVGTIGARQANDHVITAYRDHGHALAVGSDVGAVMAELMGKATGVVGGRGGSMHLAAPEQRYWGGYGIVGGQIPLGVGLALAEQYKGSDGACLCYMGDGSTNIGYFHESMNLAKVWNLPIVFVGENNKYGMGTSIERASAVHTLVEKAKGYKISAKQVDGMNVFEVYAETQKALKKARSGKGPVFLEMIAYRYEGHSIGDRTRYRPEGELDFWRDEKDPIALVQTRLLEEFGATQEELLAIQQEIDTVVEAAVKFADESPWPDVSTLMDYIYPDTAEVA